MEVVVTYLEMKAPPILPPPSPPRRPGLSVVRALKPTISYYRYLYDTVGEKWQWVDRRRLSDARLAAIIQDTAFEVYVLYVDGMPAGYAELDRRQFPDIELAHFGIMPEFIGPKLGAYPNTTWLCEIN